MVIPVFQLSRAPAHPSPLSCLISTGTWNTKLECSASTREHDAEWSWTRQAQGAAERSRQGRNKRTTEGKPLLSLNRQEFRHSTEQPLQFPKKERPPSCCPWLLRPLSWSPVVSAERFCVQEMLSMEIRGERCGQPDGR